MKKTIFLTKIFSTLFLLSILLNSCEDSKSGESNENKSTGLEEEFVQDMSEKGNDEISIDDLENDLSKMDEELESLMQDMENEMEEDSNEKTDSIE